MIVIAFVLCGFSVLGAQQAFTAYRTLCGTWSRDVRLNALVSRPCRYKPHPTYSTIFHA